MSAFWVNLSHDDKWVGGPVTSKAYAGKLRLKWTLKNDGLGIFRFRVVTVSDGVDYSNGEKGRNPRFKGNNLSSWYSVYKDREVITEIDLPAAGGVTYRVDGTLGETTVSSETFETRRILYYQPMTMVGVDEPDIQEVEDHFWGAGDGFYVKLQREKAGQTLTRKNYLDNWFLDDFAKNVKEKYQLAERSPVGFAIAWVTYLTYKEDRDVEMSKRKVGGSKLHSWDQANSRLTITTTYLWHGIEPDDDAKKDWFTNLTVTLYGDAGTKTIAMSSNDPSRVDLGDEAEFDDGGHRKVVVDLRDHGAGEVASFAFKLDYKGVAGWTAGSTKEKQRYLAVATRSRWQARSAAAMKKTLLHELGHMVGMVPNGAGRMPDKPPNYYSGQGHLGPHCAKDMTYGSDGWAGTPGCIMFGADEVGGNARAGTFCADCKLALRKLDLSTLGVEE